MTAITINDLSIKISHKTICAHFSCEFSAGQSWGILGKNGVGKTTLLHTLCHLRDAYKGDIHLNNTDIRELSRKQIAQKIGILLQHSEDPFPVTVLETVLGGRHPYLSSWQWESQDDIDKATSALKIVELDELADRAVNQLSGGERQRVSIATLLTQDPEIFFLDEPNSHLDLHHQISSLDYIRQYVAQHNRLLVMNLHDINLAARYCSHILLMQDDGQIISGESSQILTEENLSQTFNHPVYISHAGNNRIFYPG